MANDMVFAPWRTLDDFILSQSRFEINKILSSMVLFSKCAFYRFQVPTYDNKEKFRNRIVSNLIYYQTNYAISSIVIFSFITFSNPFKMLLGLFTMSLCKWCQQKKNITVTKNVLNCIVIGLLYYFDANNHEVKKIKKEHPTLTMMAAFFCGFFFIYQV